jgi:hypothetical protein
VSNVEQTWEELKKLNFNTPKALNLYGRYLMEILHDKENGLDYLKQAKDAAKLK